MTFSNLAALDTLVAVYLPSRTSRVGITEFRYKKRLRPPDNITAIEHYSQLPSSFLVRPIQTLAMISSNALDFGEKNLEGIRIYKSSGAVEHDTERD